MLGIESAKYLIVVPIFLLFSGCAIVQSNQVSRIEVGCNIPHLSDCTSYCMNYQYPPDMNLYERCGKICWEEYCDKNMTVVTEEFKSKLNNFKEGRYECGLTTSIQLISLKPFSIEGRNGFIYSELVDSGNGFGRYRIDLDAQTCDEIKIFCYDNSTDIDGTFNGTIIIGEWNIPKIC